MTAIEIVPFDWSYLDSAASLYQHTYPVPRYGELTPHDISREVIVGHVMRDTFIGVLAVSESDKVLGLAWGFASPNDNLRLKELVSKKLGPEWVESTFVIEAFALHHDHFGSDLAQNLHDGLVSRVQEHNYERIRVRLESARLDHIPETLTTSGWEQLQSLAHVSWLGKSF